MKILIFVLAGVLWLLWTELGNYARHYGETISAIYYTLKAISIVAFWNFVINLKRYYDQREKKKEGD